MYANLVVAYDGSEGAKAALDRAAELAASGGASLSLVESTAAGPPVVRGSKASPEQRAGAREQLREALDRLPAELEASPWVVGGPPGEAILAVAAEIGADLIVTGSRAHGRLARALLGSVSSELVHGAHCDVLVVHPRA